jgi:hypothetical protein
LLLRLTQGKDRPNTILGQIEDEVFFFPHILPRKEVSSHFGFLKNKYKGDDYEVLLIPDFKGIHENTEHCI